MTLYLKYRPRNLDELDIPEVGESLKKIIKSESIPHAFLFAGPKGTGKTSAARILAKILDCEHLSGEGKPCDKCDQCLSITKGNNLDVIEMDAASHRGIDDVRTLRDAVKLAPTSAKKKIYIIDEAHMLTTEASNALLKTLEEPPEHVIFILATTNPEKLIDTIRSRTTLIAFRKANTPEIIRSLKRVIEKEQIKIDDSLVEKIADLSGGAFRDAIKILEQFSLEGEEYLARFQKSDLTTFIENLIKRDEKSAINEIENNVARGISMAGFLETFLEVLHQAILADVGLPGKKIEGLNRENLVDLIEIFTHANSELVNSPIEQLPVELGVVKWCSDKDRRYVESELSHEKPVKKVEPAPVEEEKEVKANLRTMNVDNPVDAQDVASLKSEDLLTDQVVSLGVNDDIWKNILLAIRPINASIEGLLRASKPVGYDGKTLTLGVYYRFHKERLEDLHHKKILEDVITSILNNPTRVACTLVEPPPKKVIEESIREPVLTETKDQDIMKLAEDIFSN